jgi:hypothetical protein
MSIFRHYDDKPGEVIESAHPLVNQQRYPWLANKQVSPGNVRKLVSPENRPAPWQKGK